MAHSPARASRGTSSRFNLTDLSASRKRADEEREQKRRDARIAELQTAQTRTEDEVIRKLSAEDQRAAEGDGAGASAVEVGLSDLEIGL